MDDGARTHDRRNHNPELYQLSYAHHRRCDAPVTAHLNWHRRAAATPHRACNRAVTDLPAPRPAACHPPSSGQCRRPDGAPSRNRTCNHRLRRPGLYPVELRAPRSDCGIRASRLHPDSGSVVGETGFEPATPCSQSRCATRLPSPSPRPNEPLVVRA